MSKMKGKFVVIEGVDASGKNTQARMLVEKLKAEGVRAELISFPSYETSFGKIIKQYLSGELGALTDLNPYAIALLYAADRFQRASEIEKKLASGIFLVADRYAQSNYGHQGAKFGSSTERKKFFDWITLTEAPLPQPDLVIFLDAPVEATRKLLEGRGREKDLHEKDSDYLKKTREAYLEAAEAYGWVIIDCADGNEFKPREEIAEMIRKAVSPLLQQRI